ncbi:MAG: hypothetical protein ACI9KS_000313 [Sulfitobacter sp.]|jgi:hypothetical protein
MLNSIFSPAALGVAMMLPSAALAAGKDNPLIVRLTVNPMILLFVTDNTMDMTANDITEANLDGTGLSRPDGRAEFFVAANTGYNITLAPDEVWGVTGTAKVKFVGMSDNSNYIAGELFLDTDMSSDARMAGDTDIVSWDPTGGVVRRGRGRGGRGGGRGGINSGGAIVGGPVAGNVAHSNASRGVHRYGVGAIFDPQDWSGRMADNLSGSPSAAQSIAPPDVYATTVTVTVSNI